MGTRNSSVIISPTLTGFRFVIFIACLIDNRDCPDRCPVPRLSHLPMQTPAAIAC
jgi:hypothetical protein